jgi:hypothetical protein
VKHQTLAEALALIWLQAVAGSCAALGESIDQRRRARQRAVRTPRPSAPAPIQPPSWLR